MEHEAHTQHPNNYRAVFIGTEEEGNWMIKENFYVDHANRAQQSTQIIHSRSKSM